MHKCFSVLLRVCVSGLVGVFRLVGLSEVLWVSLCALRITPEHQIAGLTLAFIKTQQLGKERAMSQSRG